MIRIFFFIFLVFVMSFFNAKACLNYYYSIDKNGHLHSIGNSEHLTLNLSHFNKNFNKEKQVSSLHKHEKKLASTHSYKNLSDYSVTLLKLGKNKEALQLLIELYKYFPKEYNILANLGTAYELNNKADSALKYINIGLKLNPSGHEKSEWVHIKILETKLNLQKDNFYLQKNSVLQLSEKQKLDTLIRKQIKIQVQERFPFSPSPDPIMASIFVDLGDCFANTYSIEYARVLYQIASEYYGDKFAIIYEKIKNVEKLATKYSTIKPEPHTKNPHGETDNSKVGWLSYKQFIDDNDKTNYSINWSAINMNVQSLVKMVDFTKKN